MHRTDKYSEHSSIIWPVWPNGWVFVYELSGSGFESSCSHLKIFQKKKKKEKKRKIKKLFKMKELSQIFLGKGLLVSIKEQLCLTKRHFANLEG